MSFAGDASENSNRLGKIPSVLHAIMCHPLMHQEPGTRRMHLLHGHTDTPVAHLTYLLSTPTWFR